MLGLALAGCLTAAATACTSSGGDHTVPPGSVSGPGHPSGAATGAAATAITLDVVGDLASGPQGSGTGSVGDRGYLEGIQMAVRDVNASGGVSGRRLAVAVQDAGDSSAEATRLLEGDATAPLAAVLFVGPGPSASAARAAFERTDTPLILLEGDLYTSDGLFREVFQAGIPWSWQVHAIARYLVRDRRSSRIVFAGVGPEAPAAALATRGALSYWGGALAGVALGPGPGAPARLARATSGADAVIDFGPPAGSLAIARAVAGSGRGAPRIAAGSSLLAAAGVGATLPAGTVACDRYTWDGWAEPIPRVGRFIQEFHAFSGHAAGGMEQEGYDALRTLADALQRTGGKGGGVLVDQLERTHHRTYSGFPIDLGPDDHTFAPRDEVGMFAVPGPGERGEPWMAPLGQTWRPLMRTFTYDSRRDAILPTDRTVFFPGWAENEPAPFYWQSRYGIVSRPSDPLH